MKRWAMTVSIVGMLAGGCSTDSRSIRIDDTTGALPANSVPEHYKNGVADEIYKMQGGAPKVVELRISQPFNDLLTGDWVEVSVKIPATVSIGDAPAKCYKVKFHLKYVVAIRPAELNGCSGGMEDMLAFYQRKYPS